MTTRAVALGCVLGALVASIAGCSKWRKLRDRGHTDPEVEAERAADAARVPIPSGADTAPEPPRTPRQSADAVPAENGQRGRGYAPPLPHAEAAAAFAFGREGPTPEGGLLACKLVTTHQPDQGLKGLFGAALPDLDLESEVHGFPVVAHGPEDATSAYLTAPLVTLARGTALSFHVYDRDGIGRDDLGSVSAKNEGRIPFEGAGDGHTVTCTVLPRDVTEARARERIARADRDLGALAGNLRASTAEVRMGRRALEVACDGATAGVAAWIGWGDPRVERRQRWCDAMRARHRELVKRELDGELARAGKTARVTSHGAAFELRATDLACDAESVGRVTARVPAGARRAGSLRTTPGCLIELAATEAGDEDARSPFGTLGLANVRVTVARADGETFEGEVWAEAREPEARATRLWLSAPAGAAPAAGARTVIVLLPLGPDRPAALAFP